MSRHAAGPEEAIRADERGYAVLVEPFTPEQPCHEPADLLASPHDDRCAELPPVDQECRFPREDEVLAIDSQNES